MLNKIYSGRYLNKYKTETRNIDQNLQNYIEENIYPLYTSTTIDKAHRISHIIQTVVKSLKIAKNYNCNLNIVYVVASYHDIGNLVDGKPNHEINSTIFFMKDKFILDFFSEEDRIIIKEAIEDHRHSNPNTPRSFYGKVISDADRDDIILEHIVLRCYQYRIAQ